MFFYVLIVNYFCCWIAYVEYPLSEVLRIRKLSNLRILKKYLNRIYWLNISNPRYKMLQNCNSLNIMLVLRKCQISNSEFSSKGYAICILLHVICNTFFSLHSSTDGPLCGFQFGVLNMQLLGGMAAHVFRKLRQENHDFQAILGYTASSRPA